MNMKIKTVCVFASSSLNLDKKYHKCAYILGNKLADNGYDIVYGGSNRGLMGEVTLGAFQHGADIIGVMPEKLYNLGIEKGNCTRFIITKGMRERKAKMDELSEAVIALPGGFGTIEELSEMIVQKQLNYNNKPIILLNSYGFYDELNSFFEKLISEKFAPEISRKIYYLADNVDEVIKYLNEYDFSFNSETIFKLTK